MPIITTEVDVDIDMDDIDTDDLIDELESRGFTVVDPGKKEKSVQAKERIMDDIHNLFQDFKLWDDSMMTNYRFEIILKKFFSEHLDKNVL